LLADLVGVLAKVERKMRTKKNSKGKRTILTCSPRVAAPKALTKGINL